jgi:hypothetical protein
VPMQSNSAGGATTGAGMELLGDVGQTFGGALSTQGNDASGNGLGIAVGPCTSSQCQASGIPGVGQASTGNTIQNNTAGSNILSGVTLVGDFQPNEEVEQIPSIAEPALGTAGNTLIRNTWTGNGTIPTEVNGTNLMDGTGWGGGCSSQAGSCDTLNSPNTLVYEGANQTINATNPGSGTLTLAVCNPVASPAEPLPAGSEITFDANTAQAADGGTFFVTAAAIVPASGALCSSATPPSTNITVQAVAPALVGTANNANPITVSTPASLVTGQPYILGTGDTVVVNQNLATVVVAANTYGSGANSNSCTPLGKNGIPNTFGASAPPGSATLNASTGGVNATYAAC